MYVKNNFSNYFVLATILLYVLGFTFDYWHSSIFRDYSSITVNLQALALGLYSLLYENGFLNANPYYQVFVVALITSYQTVFRISRIVYQIYHYIHYISVAWAALTLVLYNKLPNVLNYIFRYEIGFSIILYIIQILSRYIRFNNDIALAIAAGISLGFVFISHLTFARIANYSSIFLFSHMVTRGLILLFSYIPYVPYNVLFDFLVYNITGGIVLVIAFGYHYMSNRSQAILLESDEPNYSADPSED